tara:strand:+ start:33 stop:584 length:552 start_codon:yes stop_codon:yes gene_type:complete
MSNFVINPYSFVPGIGSYTSQCPRTGHGDMYGAGRNGIGARLYKTDTTFPYVGNNTDLYSVSAYFKVDTSATIDVSCIIYQVNDDEPTNPSTIGTIESSKTLSVTSTYTEFTFEGTTVNSSDKGMIIAFIAEMPAVDESFTINNNGAPGAPCGDVGAGQVYYKDGAFQNYKTDTVPITVTGDF